MSVALFDGGRGEIFHDELFHRRIAKSVVCSSFVCVYLRFRCSKKIAKS